MSISKNLVKLLIKITVAIVLVSAMTGLFLVFNLYESRTPLDTMLHLDLFSVVTNSSGVGSFAIQGLTTSSVELSESEFSSVMVFARAFGLLAFTSVIVSTVFSAIDVFDIDLAGSDEKPKSFVSLMRAKMFVALQFSLPAVLVYFGATVVLGMLDDSIYYPISYAIKVPLMIIITTGIANIATEESDDKISLENIKSALADSIELIQVNLIHVLIQIIAVTALMFVPGINLVVGFIWCILAPVIDTAMYYKTFLEE